jgi:Leucine-rich repeat (LRR) protein
MTNLYGLSLYSNQLTGLIPSSLGSLINLWYLYLLFNQLSGSIPSSLGNLINLQSLVLLLNQLTGLISSSLGSLTILYGLYLSSNQLTGLIPSSLGNLINLQYLYLDSSYLNGSIPSLGNLTNLQYLYLDSNQLSGSIPSSLGNSTKLTQVLISSNHLSGSIPLSIERLISLQSLYLDSNQLSGTIPDLSAIANLLFFNAYDNRLSGTIPVSTLQSGHLQGLFLSVNCFSGTISPEIYANINLTELVMGGLHAAQYCTQKAVRVPTSFSPRSSYVQNTAMHGSIPSCIYNMPSLEYLSLSGNNLIGSLSRDLTIVPSLQVLDLSHIRLTGSIPNMVFNHGFSSLDLSFNRFTGTIPENVSDMFYFKFNTSLSLQVNLLSGTLPVAWTEATSINVLHGNMFACKDGIGSTINLPVHDPIADIYQCGSQYTNIALLICLFLFIVYSFVWFIISWLRRKWVNDEIIQEGWRLLMVLMRSRKVVWQLWSVLAIFCCSMILYGGLTVYHPTYSEQYMWTVVLSGQKGVLPAVLLLLWLLYVMVQVLMWCTQIWASRRDAIGVNNKDKVVELGSSRKNHMITKGKYCGTGDICVLILFAVNIVVVLVFNGLYVLSTTQKLPKRLSICCVLMIALFKLVWNTVLHHIGMNAIFINRVAGEAGVFVVNLDSVLTVLSVFNNILAPLVTEIFVNPNCLKYIFVPVTTVLFPAPPICKPALQYDAEFIDVNTVTSSVQSIDTCSPQHQISYTPGFAYNFECSSSMLEDFAYAFIYRCMLNLFLMPILWILLKRCQQRSFVKLGTASRLFRLLTACLPTLLRPLSRPSGYPTNEINSENSMDQIMKEWKYLNVSIFRHIGMSAAIRCASNLRIRLLADVSILLSFGVLFPPLGLLMSLVLGVDVLGTVLIIRRLRYLGREEKNEKEMNEMNTVSTSITITSTIEAPIEEASIAKVNTDNTVSLENYHQLLQEMIFALDSGFAEMPWKFAENVQCVLHMVVLLWGFALYDVLGREVGIVNAIWVLVVTVTSPFWLYWIVSVLMSRLNSLWPSMKKEDARTGIEARETEMIIQNPIIDNEWATKVESNRLLRI